jgi:hypothetical protein
MFCVKRALDLSVQSCIADFSRVEKHGTVAWHSNWHCKGCELGAVNAGRDVAVLRVVEVVASARQVCARCHRPDERFIGNRLCRSCDARDRELARGRNGKGSFPRLLAARLQLHDVALFVVGVGQQVVNRATGALEAIITLVRRERQALRFARSVPVYRQMLQLSFWGGC